MFDTDQKMILLTHQIKLFYFYEELFEPLDPPPPPQPPKVRDTITNVVIAVSLNFESIFVFRSISSCLNCMSLMIID